MFAFFLQEDFFAMDGPVVEELPVMRSMSPSTVFGEHIEIDFSQTLIKDPSQTVKITPSETSFPPSESNKKKRKKTPGVRIYFFLVMNCCYSVAAVQVCVSSVT